MKQLSKEQMSKVEGGSVAAQEAGNAVGNAVAIASPATAGLFSLIFGHW